MNRIAKEGRQTLLVVLLIFGLLAGIIFTVQGCTKKSPEETLDERRNEAFRVVTDTVWVRNPDIKDRCFGVWFGYKAVGYVTIECRYVEHLLVNPTPPGLPPEGGGRE